tara:strand:+ start:102 stop:1214 length:1113 start_codon:yes stop_codon:yes gene_type:complete
MIGILFMACAVVYAITFLGYFVGLGVAFNYKAQPYTSDLNATVIIAFRNEANSLSQLLDSLLSQTDQNFQLILVNDHSSDHYLSIIRQYEERFLDFQLIELDQQEGKKAGIKAGVCAAKYELIITTDADCTLPLNWINHWKESFKKNAHLKLAAGIVTLTGNTFFEKLQQLEFTSLIASSIGAANNDKAIMLNAANMVYRKDFYLEVSEELDAIPSPTGDDIFLLEACKKKYPDGFAYLQETSLIVNTPAKKTLKEFLFQRKRWASKTKYYRDLHMKKVALIVGITNLLLLIGGIGSFFSYTLWLPFLVLFTVKLLVDYSLLYRYLKGIQQLNLLNYFLIVELILPFYIIFVAFTSQKGSYNWKDRTYKN